MNAIATSERTVSRPVARITEPTSPLDDRRPPEAIGPRRRCTYAKLQVTGLMGVAEAVWIEQCLVHEAGVIHVSVNPATGLAYVVYDIDRTRGATLRQAIEHVGFGAQAI